MNGNLAASIPAPSPGATSHTGDFLPFHVPSIGDEEIAEVVATLRSGWLTTGTRAVEFERAFAASIGARTRRASARRPTTSVAIWGTNSGRR